MTKIKPEDWEKIGTMVFEDGKTYLLAFDRNLHDQDDVVTFLDRLTEIGIKAIGIYGDGTVPEVFALEGERCLYQKS